MELTPDDLDLMRLMPVAVYSPGLATIEKYGPLVSAGLLDVEDVGSDEMQETIHVFTLTPAGRAALVKP